MRESETWLFFVPPGWLIGGTIVELTDTVVVLKNGVYLEMAASGHALFASVPRATTAKALKAACTTSWGLPEKFIVRREAIFLAGKCQLSLAALAGAEAEKAIRDAG